MEEEINWRKFKFPRGCKLKKHQKSAVCKEANKGEYHPWRICNKIRKGECPESLHEKCYWKVIDFIVSKKKK